MAQSFGNLSLWSAFMWASFLRKRRSRKKGTMSDSVKKVGIFIFDDVEVLDFAAPYEVFSRTRLQPGVESRRSNSTAPFTVFTVAKSIQPVIATGGLEIVPGYSFSDCPAIDLLVVPGG